MGRSPRHAGDTPRRGGPRVRPAHYGWGGLGYASVGFLHGSFHFLDEALRDPAVLGPGWAASDTAFAFGGGGGALLGRRFWLGGKGYGIILPTEASDRGRAHVFGGGGGLDVGVAVINRPHAIVIPYLGAGGFGATVDVRNRTSAPMTLGAGHVLAPGARRTYGTGFWTIDAGVRAFGLTFDRRSGWAAGIDLGIMTSLVPSSFEVDGSALRDLPPGRMTAGYVRLMIGGGGFFQPSP